MPTLADKTRVVIDNGGHTCKVGFAGQSEPVKLMPNGLAKSKSEHKVFIADQLDGCSDFSALQYRLSLERGCLVNWDTQAEVWARAFGPEVLKVNPADCSLLLTETPVAPTSIQDTCAAVHERCLSLARAAALASRALFFGASNSQAGRDDL